MATKKTSAQKRHEQSEKRRLHNKEIKSTCKTYARQFVEAVNAKDKALAETKLRTLESTLDSARSKGVLKLNAVARKKSRMARLFNKTFAPTEAANN
ncbi:MAG: 30S ribosomal protein S20 [Treponema sp.]|nr:30S ribosomal protein S20 [Treponema sp.]MDE6245118.1 30S ribosomal protein S20 [Treponemataceae bacterium]MBD5404586.1 30S ribosomal protein S20 [Treponema sp.]MBD5407585.1 30S ribosomal protein S20 [Treponema sp.]MBD5408934.1 30S ribosomal protein S20 [Treponema sp.]